MIAQVKFEEKSHKYYDLQDREYVSVSRVLEYFGISQIDKLKEIHGEEHFAMLARFGKEIHQLTAADDKHELYTWKYDKKLDPYIQGWCSWRCDTKPIFVAIEQPLISQVWGFAGTPDRVTHKGSALAIPDLKSGSKTLAEEIQTAFYQILVEENYKLPVRERFSVHLDPKKPRGYQVEPHTDRSQVNLAKCMMTVYNYKKSKDIL